MWLLCWRNSRFELDKFQEAELPKYAILSHTWAQNDVDEVSFEDIRNRKRASRKPGYAKLVFCRDQASRDGYQHFWVDTACIDKRSEAELAQSIRSMFRWYKQAEICYVYLSDVAKSKRKGSELRWQDTFRTCRWFTRGWTLQELIACNKIKFFARDGELGDKSTLRHLLEEAGVDSRALDNYLSCDHKTRLAWINGRVTKEPEDLAYCMMGICGVVFDPRYGEGSTDARLRLEDAIRKKFGTAAMFGDTIEERRSQLLQRLKATNTETRKLTITNALANTCRWVLEDDMYVSWLDSEALRVHCGFLWIKGKPGSGKSVMIKFIDQHLSRSRPGADSGDIHISFYFNARGTPLEKTFLGLYRSLLRQLLLAAPSQMSVLDSLSFNLSFDSDAIVYLKDALANGIRQLRQRRVYCFIDALDECQDRDIEEMVIFLQGIQQDALANETSFLVCFASRHYPIHHIPTPLQLNLEDAQHHKHDLVMYIESRLFGNSNIDDDVVTSIVNRSNGIFLWVVLLVGMLTPLVRNGRTYAIQQQIRETPQGLVPLFRSVLLRDSDETVDTIEALQLLLCSARPLTLEEFYFARMASIDPQDNQMWTQGKSEAMLSFLTSSSKGLAELTKGEIQSVQFIHESVREYLLKDGLKELDPQRELSICRMHEQLRDLCCKAFSNADLKQLLDAEGINQPELPATSSTRSFVSTAEAWLRKYYPFLEYATTFALYHAEQAAAERSQLSFLQSYDYGQWRRVTAPPERHQSGYQASDEDLPVYICAMRGYTRLLQTFAQNKYDMEVELSSQYWTPLIAAIMMENLDSAVFLLEHQGASNALRIVDDCFAIVRRGPGAAIVSLMVASDSSKRPWSWAHDNQLRLLAVELLRRELPSERLGYLAPMDIFHYYETISLSLELSAEATSWRQVADRVLDRSRGAWDNESLRRLMSESLRAKHLEGIEVLLDHGACPHLDFATTSHSILEEAVLRKLSSFVEVMVKASCCEDATTRILAKLQSQSSQPDTTKSKSSLDVSEGIESPKPAGQTEVMGTGN